jgi:tRNA dimethylallyltransferase
VGKSDLAIELARRFGGEVVNSDSMQVFRHLPIGTAAPTPDMLAAVPHHLFAFLEPDQDPDAGTYARLASEVIRGLCDRGRLPVLVGGTFFWLRALFHGLSEMPSVPDEVKTRVRQTLDREGLGVLRERLMAGDPTTATRLAPMDSQRISRAVEILEATGTPMSVWQQSPPRPAIDARVLRIILDRPRDVLYGRIEARLDAMFRDGLVDEVRNVLAMGYQPSVRPLRSSSYLPIVEHLDGLIDLGTARTRIAQGHRNYAKRQSTWLRREQGERFDAGQLMPVNEVVERFLHENVTGQRKT